MVNPILRGGGAPASELRGAGDAAVADCVVRGRRDRLDVAGLTAAFSGVLPRAHEHWRSAALYS